MHDRDIAISGNELSRLVVTARVRPYNTSDDVYTQTAYMIVSLLPKRNAGQNQARVIVQLLGGLGNQMFQYALGRAVSHRTGAPLLLDTSVIKFARQETPRGYDLDIFKLQPTFATRDDVARYHSHGAGLAAKIARRLRRPISSSELVCEREFSFQPEIFDFRPPVYLAGLWQSYRYFAEIEDVLRAEFRFRDGLPSSATAYAHNLSRSGTVCVHVRRGDYTEPKNIDVIGLSSVDYYRRAVARVRELVEQPVFFIFSDDLAWCRANFDWLGQEICFVDYAVPAGMKPQASDLQLMTRAEYFITANSTFSWWAAWLAGERAKLVITPREWFKHPQLKADDLIPAHWERL